MTQDDARAALIRGAKNTTASFVNVSRETLLVALGETPGQAEAKPARRPPPPVAVSRRKDPAGAKKRSSKK